MPSIFERLDPGRGDSSGPATWKAAGRIRERIAGFRSGEVSPAGTDRPVSLAELRPTDADGRWLTDWVRGVDRRTAEKWLRGTRSGSDFGLLTLLALAEACRRDGAEHEVYQTAVALPWDSDVHDFLFSGGRAPRQSLREGIEAAARRHGLRHVFDDRDRQRWYATIGLQHGFTARGAVESLPAWLAGVGRPRVVDDLLGEGGEGLASDSFRALWRAMADARPGRERDVAAVMRDSPWIPPDRIDLIAAAACRPRPTTCTVGGSPAGRVSAGANAVDEGEVNLVGPVRLDWPHRGKPAFVFESVVPAGDCGDVPRLLAGGRELIRWVRQPGGGYAATGTARPLPAAEVPPELVVELADESGRTVASQTVAVRSADAEVQVWDGAGRPADPLGAPPNDHRGLLLLADRDLDWPADTAEFAPGPAGMRFLRVPPGGLARFRLTADGDVVWPTTELSRRAADLDVEVSASPPEVDPRKRGGVRLLVRCESGYTPRALRVGGQTHELADDGRRPQAGPIDPLALPVPWSARCAVTLDGPGGRVRVSRTAAVRPVGLFLRDAAGTGWELPDLDGELRCERLAAGPVRVVTPAPDPSDRREWALLAGDRSVGQRTDKIRRIRELPARGERLTLCRGPYNRPACDPEIALSGPIVDRGLVDRCLAVSGTVQLRLTRPIEPRAGHAVHLLRPERARTVVPAQIVAREDGRVWEVRPDALPGDSLASGRPVAVAVSYKGLRLGAWWADDWADRLCGGQAGPHTSPAVVAAAVRWFGLPVLAAADTVRAFAAAHPAECVRAWLIDSEHEALRDDLLPEQVLPGTAERLVPRSDDFTEGWHMAVRDLLRDWRPTPAEANDAVVAHNVSADADVSDGDLPRAPDDTFRYAPRTLARLLTAAAAEPGPVRHLLKKIHETPRPTENPGEADGLAPHLTDLCDWAVAGGVLAERPDDWRERNLNVALNNGAFRNTLVDRLCRAVADGRLTADPHADTRESVKQ